MIREKRPHKLLDKIKELYNLKTDAALANLLDSDAPYISKVRSGKLRNSPELILRVHDATGLSIAEIKSFM